MNEPGYETVLDGKRISTQRDNIKTLMSDNKWRTLSEIHNITGYPEASISACLRDFRKQKFGSHTVDRQRRGVPSQGWWEYRLTLKTN